MRTRAKNTGFSFGENIFDPVADPIKCHDPEFICL